MENEDMTARDGNVTIWETTGACAVCGGPASHSVVEMKGKKLPGSETAVGNFEQVGEPVYGCELHPAELVVND